MRTDTRTYRALAQIADGWLSVNPIVRFSAYGLGVMLAVVLVLTLVR